MRILISNTIGAGLLAVAPAMAQNCGALGSPYSFNGCIVPGGNGTPSYRIQASPVLPGQFRVEPLGPSISPPAPYRPYPAYPHQPIPQVQPAPRNW